MNRMPRNQRFILSQRVEVTSIRILELVIDLGRDDTPACRAKISREVQKLHVLVRLCKDLCCMSFRSYEHACVLLSEISALAEDRKREGKPGDGLQRFVR